MSNISNVNALLTAINHDRFAEIEAHHAPDVLFQSFRGPTIHDAVGAADWQREFLRDYADCNYGSLEYIEEGDTVAVRATIEAKGYDWRPFTQRVVEVFCFEAGELVQRRLYGMLRDIEFTKPVQAAMDNALGYRGTGAGDTRKVVEPAFAAMFAGDASSLPQYFGDKCVLIDGVYGMAAGFENVSALAAGIPKPAFGIPRVTNVLAGAKDALVEVAIDPSRPRYADWVRVVDGKILVVETYWMLREIGVDPRVNYAHDRHQRQVILPV